MALKTLTSRIRTRFPLLFPALLVLTLLSTGAAGGEGLFGEPPPDGEKSKPVERPVEFVRPDAEAPADEGPGHFYRRLWLSLDLDHRRRKLRPVKVRDRYEDNVGDSSFEESLDMDLYSSEDDVRTTTLGLTLHWRPWQRLELHAGVRRPLYGKSKHTKIEYDDAPIASPDLDFAHGASVELAGGAGWEALFFEEGPLRNFGLWVGTEFRAGWGDDVRSPDDDDEFDLDGNDEVDYDADWQAIDVETRVFGRFNDTFEGVLTVYAGVGLGWFFYHEEWDGVFEGGEEVERMEFDYREQNLVFGSAGMRAERGPIVVDAGCRYGGEYMVFVKIGWKF